jgi:hypothetical protein
MRSGLQSDLAPDSGIVAGASAGARGCAKSRQQPFLIQPYVQGAGYNGLTDDDWREIRILQH